MPLTPPGQTPLWSFHANPARTSPSTVVRLLRCNSDEARILSPPKTKTTPPPSSRSFLPQTANHHRNLPRARSLSHLRTTGVADSISTAVIAVPLPRLPSGVVSRITLLTNSPSQSLTSPSLQTTASLTVALYHSIAPHRVPLSLFNLLFPFACSPFSSPLPFRFSPFFSLETSASLSAAKSPARFPAEATSLSLPKISGPLPFFK